MFPSHKRLGYAIITSLLELGNEARSIDVYPLVTEKFPELTKADLLEKVPSGANKWINKIQWARASLKNQGLVESKSYGIWILSRKGCEFAKKHYLYDWQTVENISTL